MSKKKEGFKIKSMESKVVKKKIREEKLALALKKNLRMRKLVK